MTVIAISSSKGKEVIKLLVVIAAVVVDAGLALLITLVVSSPHIPMHECLPAAGVVLAIVLAAVVIIRARIAPAGLHATRLMRAACLGTPLLWFLGSLDSGTVSGHEWISIAVVAGLMWGNWAAFKLACRRP